MKRKFLVAFLRFLFHLKTTIFRFWITRKYKYKILNPMYLWFKASDSHSIGFVKKISVDQSKSPHFPRNIIEISDISSPSLTAIKVRIKKLRQNVRHASQKRHQLSVL